jgi:hypothetical protein
MTLVARLNTTGWRLDAFPPNMKATASLTVEDNQAAIFAHISGRLVPKVEGNAMLSREAAFMKEDLSARGIGAREN